MLLYFLMLCSICNLKASIFKTVLFIGTSPDLECDLLNLLSISENIWFVWVVQNNNDFN